MIVTLFQELPYNMGLLINKTASDEYSTITNKISLVSFNIHKTQKLWNFRIHQMLLVFIWLEGAPPKEFNKFLSLRSLNTTQSVGRKKSSNIFQKVD